MTEDWIELRKENETLIAISAEQVKKSRRTRTWGSWIWGILAVLNFSAIFVGPLTPFWVVVGLCFTAWCIFSLRNHYNFWTRSALDFERLQREAHTSRIEIDKIIRDLRGF